MWVWLLLVPLVASFNNNALIPNIEEARGALTQMAMSLRSAATADTGRVYHEVLSAEELLTRMRKQIQTDQMADQNITTSTERTMATDATVLQRSLAHYSELMAQHMSEYNGLQANASDTRRAADTLNNTLQGALEELKRTSEQCSSMRAKFESRALQTTADIATVSRILNVLPQVECSELNNFIQNLALPTSISMLELDEGRRVLCDCNNLLQSDGLTEGCNCGSTSSSEEPEFSCEKRKQNLHELLSSLLDQLHSGSVQDSRTYEQSYTACTNDQNAQQKVVVNISQDLGRLEQILILLGQSMPESEREGYRIQIAINATQDALNSVNLKRRKSYDTFVHRFEMRRDQVELLNSILGVLHDLTRSNYSQFHLMLRDGCPTFCNRHGICSNGMCECESGYSGIDCAISSQQANVCPFQNGSAPCTNAICQGVHFQNISQESSCAAVMCDYCRDHLTSDSACIYAPIAMFCAERDRAHNCSTIHCPAAIMECGLRRIVREPFVGCCFNPLLDCIDKCTNTECSTTAETCPAGKAVRYPLRDCCFNATTDCVDECSLSVCEDREPTCPIGKQVRHPFAGCCFNATTDCEDECTLVVCDDAILPLDACRAKGLRWTGSTVGCCFSADTDCAAGDDPGQAAERFALTALFNSTNGQFWSNQKDSKWLSDAWVCYWYGVDCIGSAGTMTVSSIRLSANGLSGMLPAELGLLKNLTLLDVSENSIEGPIPSELSQLSNLHSLKLRRNNLSGVIPEGVAALPKLEVFDIGFNFMNGTLPASLSHDGISVTCGSNCMCNGNCAPMRTLDDQYNTARRSCPVC